MSTLNYQFASKTKTVRRTFFSFHFHPDNQRAEVVQQSWLTKEDRQAAGFFDGSAFETKKRTSEDALKGFLTEQLKGSSVTCVLVGSQTGFRPWVRYELVRSFHRGNGLLAIRVHGIRDWNKQFATAGPNPFEHLAYRVANDRVYWHELNNGVWLNYDKVPSMALSEVAYDLMLECSVLAACQILRISWDEADGIKQRAVARGLRRKQAKPVARVGVDEKSAGRGQDYVTIVAALEPGRAASVEYVGDGRKQEALDGYWQQMPREHLEAVQAVAMDMWEAYFNSTMAHVPEAAGKIVYDPYHVGRMLGDAVDRVRRGEHRRLIQEDDERLAGSKYLWLYGWENMPESNRQRFDELRGDKLKTSRAWAIKEMFRDFWNCQSIEEGREYFRNWYGWAIRSRLQPIKKVARSFKAHLSNILTYFRHRITNAALEGLNNRIAGLVKKAFGYRSRERLKTDILFHLGKLDLYPSQ